MRNTIVAAGAALLLSSVAFAGAQESPWGDEPWPPGSHATDSSEIAATREGAETTDGVWPGDEWQPDATAPVTTNAFDRVGAFSLYGYLSSTVQASFGKTGSVAVAGRDAALGAVTRVRLKGDWEPSERVLFHLEIESRHDAGLSNQFAFTQATGLGGGAVNDAQDASPQDDFRSTLFVDQAWAQLRFDRVDYQIGRVPIAWGTGYAFNPTARTNPDGNLTELGEEETTGTASVGAAVALPAQAVLEGYVAFEDRLHTGRTAPEDVEVWNYPWGARIRAYVGSFDVAAGALHEVVAARDGTGYERYLHAAAELVGSIGDLGMFAEAILTTDSFDGTDGWTAHEALESTVGLEYLFPGDVEAKVEYYRRGAGAARPADYDLAPLFTGHISVLARDYGFGLLQRTFWDYVEVSAAALVNLNDASGVALPAIEYELSDALTLGLTGIVPWGGSTSEFGGERTFDDRTVRLVRPGGVAQVKVSF